LFREFHDASLCSYPAATPKLAVYDALRRMLNAFVSDLMNEVHARVTALSATTLKDIRRAPSRIATLSTEMESARAATKKFLYANLYNSPGMEELHERAAYIVQSVFDFLMDDPRMLPDDHRAQIPGEGLARTVADYIAGMTDAFIEQLWERCGGN